MSTALRMAGRHPYAVLGAVAAVVGLAGALVGVSVEFALQHSKPRRHKEG